MATAYHESKLFHFYTEKCIELYTTWGQKIGELGSPVVGGEVDWGIMQINIGWRGVFDFEKFGDWTENWHTNIRVGSMIARDAIDRNNFITEEERQKAYYSCYNAKEHDAFKKNNVVRDKAEGFLTNIMRIRNGNEGDFDLEFEYSLQEAAKLIKPILYPDSFSDNIYSRFFKEYGEKNICSHEELAEMWRIR
ncbi:MAG: hypothetical protein FWG40_12255 [Peptococcaceae bacterium]|nr:hypothetical protein [Peptococcaceae bacterium]